MANHDKSGQQWARDALELLRADHDKFRRLFLEFDSLRGIEEEDERKSELVDEICYELTLHSMIEEEIFYPAVRDALNNDELVDDAEVDHAGARELISQLEVMYPGDEHFDTTVTVLGEEVVHHIAQEESDMFEALRASGIDLDALGVRLMTRKDALDDDLTAPPLDQDDPAVVRASARMPPRPPN